MGYFQNWNLLMIFFKKNINKNKTKTTNNKTIMILKTPIHHHHPSSLLPIQRISLSKNNNHYYKNISSSSSSCSTRSSNHLVWKNLFLLSSILFLLICKVQSFQVGLLSFKILQSTKKYPNYNHHRQSFYKKNHQYHTHQHNMVSQQQQEQQQEQEKNVVKESNIDNNNNHQQKETTTTTTTNVDVMEDYIHQFLKEFQLAWNEKDEKEVLNRFFVKQKNTTTTTTSKDENDHDTTTKNIIGPFWRDMVAFTWNICTMEGTDSILNGLKHAFSTRHRNNIRITSSTTTTSTTPTTTTWTLSTKPAPINAIDVSASIFADTYISNNDNDKDDKSNNIQIIEFWCDLNIPTVGTGKAHFRVSTPTKNVMNNNDNNIYDWKIETLLTTLLELEKAPFQVGHNRIRGNIHGPTPNRLYWKERLQQQWNSQQQQRQNSNNDNDNNGNNNNDHYDYHVVIIGGGQAGLALGARLQLMMTGDNDNNNNNMPSYCILEAGSSPGIAWRKRYPSLHLHDPVWYNHMPYLPFPESWPILCPRDKIADWMEFYAKILDLNVQTNQRVVKVFSTTTSMSSSSSSKTNNNNNNNKSSSSSSTDNHNTATASVNDGDDDDNDESTTIWNVVVEETGTGSRTNNANDDADGGDDDESTIIGANTRSTTKTTTTTTTTIRARHVVFATGNSSHPKRPKFPGHDIFRGIQIHSSQYQNGGRCFANQRVVVVGSNNSGFDIVQDLWEQGAKSVTMLQRSPSLVVSTESVLRHGLGPLYRQDAPLHHEEADLVATTIPYKLLLKRWKAVTSIMRETDAELHKGLIDAGYRMDFGPDGTGLFAKSATEGGGFYINMGCAELLIRGDVTVRYATVSKLVEDGVVIIDQGSAEEKQTNEKNNKGGNVEKAVEEEEFLPADVIIYATGFDTMDQWVAELCGEEIAQTMGRTWGLGYGKRPHKDPGPWEGELRNMWKPTTIDGLWFHGGNLAQSRHYSRFLALQLAARYYGIHTPIHGIPNPTPPMPPSTLPSQS